MRLTAILYALVLFRLASGIARAETINDAVHRGDIVAVRRMLNADTRLVRYRGSDTSNPLHWAAWDGRPEIAALLISAGADVNDRRALEGATPLWLAALAGHTDVASLLLQHGADPEIRSNDGNTALHEAAAHDHSDLAALLVAAGQSVDSPNKEQNTPLAIAAWWGQMDTARYLIAVGADIHHANIEGHTAVDMAVARGHNDIADLIRKYLAEVDERTARDLTRKTSGLALRAGYLNWATESARAREIYATSFAGDTVGPEWSTLPLPGTQQAPLRISSTPKGGRRFLGELGSQAARLTLKGLPPHTETSVYFDLYIIRSWDGNDSRFGPDVFTLSLADGPNLLHTTFYNPYLPERATQRMQAYPGEYPGDHYLPHTGAVEVDSLGHTMLVNGGNAPMDSVYKLSYTFSHHSATLSLDFAAQGLEALDNESWGITNVQVSVANPAAPVTSARHSPMPSRRPVHVVVRAVSHRATPSVPHTTARRATAGNRTTTAHMAHPAARLHPRERPPGM